VFPLDEHVLLAPRTTLGLGGPARWLAEAQSEADLVAALDWAAEREVPAVLLGGGSNLVVADAGYPGLVVAVSSRGVTWRSAGDRVFARAEAGERWDDLVASAVAAGLGGIEALSGIPGSAGATPIQNVGAYGQEIADTIRAVRVFDRRDRVVRELAPTECGFAYRDSLFRRKPERFAVLSVELELVPTDRVEVGYSELERALGDTHPTPAAVRSAVLTLRRGKSMVLDPEDPNRRSAGSFFLNPIVEAADAERVVARAIEIGVAKEGSEVPRFPTPEGRVKLSAGWLIERAGFPRGTRRGPVGLSSRHSLALVHHGGGRTADLLAFAREVRVGVAAAFGIELRPEPVFLGLSAEEAAALGAAAA
jgi:UDP-N-acetylmuramate dehydrogenase